MKSMRMLWRIGLPLLLALLVAACAATTEDKKTEDETGDTPPTITSGREYTFEEGDEQGGSFTATLTLGDTQFLYALVSDPSIAVWGTVATLNNGFLKLRITHATHPEETINRDVFASEMKNGVLAIFDADNFWVESENAYRESSPGLNRGGSCATGGEVYNAVGIPQEGFNQLSDSIYGTAQLGSSDNLTLTLNRYTLYQDMTTGTPPVEGPSSAFACIGNELVATGTTISFAQAGFGVAMGDQGSAVLVPRPATQIGASDFAQQGRIYAGFAEHIWDDPNDGMDQNYIHLQRPIRAIGQGTQGETSTLRAVPLVDIEDNEAISPDSAQIVVARSGSAPNGFFDLSTINMGAGPQPFPFTVALTPTGEYVLVGVIGNPAGTPTDWEFVVLSEQQIGTGYPVAAPVVSGINYSLLSAQGDQGGAPNLTIGTNESTGSFRVTDPNTGTNSWGTIANHSSGFVQLTLTHSTEPGQRLGQAFYGGVIPGALFFALPEDEYEPAESAFTESIAGPAVGPGCTVAYDNGTVFNVSAFPDSGFNQLTDPAWGTATVSNSTAATGGTTFDLTVTMFRIDQDAAETPIVSETIVGLDCTGTPNGVGDRFLVGPAGSATVLQTDGGFLAFPAPTTAIDVSTDIYPTSKRLLGFVQSARSDGMGDFPERYMLVTAQGNNGTSLTGAAYNIFTNTSATTEAVTITLDQSVSAPPNGRFDSGTLTDTQGVRPLRLLAWRNPLDGDKIALVGFAGNNAVDATPDDWDFIVVYEQ